jgi:aminopeptidase
MPDPRIARLASVLVHYSLEIKPGQQLAIFTSPLADELTLAVYAEALKAGANIIIESRVPGAEELYYKLASDAQLDYVPPIRKMVVESFDAFLSIEAQHNTRELSAIDPKRLARSRQARLGITETYMRR